MRTDWGSIPTSSARFAQGCRLFIGIARIDPPAGKADLAGMGRQMGACAG